MPWERTEPVNERMRFIVLHQEQRFSMTELCRLFKVSRKTGYKWVERYELAGLPGLLEDSRAPHHCPHRTDDTVQALLLAARKAHPSWGPKKLRAYLAPRHPELKLPAPSTIGDLLRRHGLSEAQRRRRKPAPSAATPLESGGPNDTWSADFKGEFRLGNGQLCYPLTVQDSYSRFLLACEALADTRTAGALPVFEKLFRTFGLPARLRTDNGAPFASVGLQGLSRLGVYCLKLGIHLDRIQPGKPTQNGRHERVHRTLKAETTRPPAHDLKGQQERFARFLPEYNEERPHEALAQVPPAQYYRPSQRALPDPVPGPEYPGYYEIRRVNNAGCFYFRGEPLFLTQVLIDELIGLTETDDGIWSIYFYDHLLARLDERTGRIIH